MTTKAKATYFTPKWVGTVGESNFGIRHVSELLNSLVYFCHSLFTGYDLHFPIPDFLIFRNFDSHYAVRVPSNRIDKSSASVFFNFSGAATLPRTISVKTVNGKLFLTATPVETLNQLKQKETVLKNYP